MIAVVTNHDDATFNNCTFFSGSINSSLFTNRLLSTSATHRNLLSLLGDGSNVFIMSHGNYDSLIDNDGNELISISHSLSPEGCRIFAFSCKSAVNLGPSLALSNSFIYFGYVDSVDSPIIEDGFDVIFKEVFDLIISSYPSVNDENDAVHFLNNLRSKIEEIEDDYYTASGPLPMHLAMNLRKMWTRMKIALPSNTNIRHPEAEPQRLAGL